MISCDFIEYNNFVGSRIQNFDGHARFVMIRVLLALGIGALVNLLRTESSQLFGAYTAFSPRAHAPALLSTAPLRQRLGPQTMTPATDPVWQPRSVAWIQPPPQRGAPSALAGVGWVPCGLGLAVSLALRRLATLGTAAQTRRDGVDPMDEERRLAAELDAALLAEEGRSASRSAPALRSADGHPEATQPAPALLAEGYGSARRVPLQEQKARAANPALRFAEGIPKAKQLTPAQVLRCKISVSGVVELSMLIWLFLGRSSADYSA